MSAEVEMHIVGVAGRIRLSIVPSQAPVLLAQ